jgi:predicted transcriptional regulator
MHNPISPFIRPIIISVRREFAQAILSKSKTVELRKSSFPKNITHAIIYKMGE